MGDARVANEGTCLERSEEAMVMSRLFLTTGSVPCFRKVTGVPPCRLKELSYRERSVHCSITKLKSCLP